jgi:hypothetical protein
MNDSKQSSPPKTVEDIYQEFLKLSPDERKKLSCMLQHDLAGQNDPDSWYATPEIAQAWNEEIDRREKLLDEGRMELIDGEEVIGRLQKIVAG